MSLYSHILKIYPISEDAKLALTTHLRRIDLPRGEYLLREGTVCRNMYFLEAGCLRGFYVLDGKEVTRWFASENDFVTSFHSFITRTPSLESLQTLEDSVLWSISHEALYTLYDKYPDIERLGRIACEKYYIRLEERYVNAQFRSATERYLQLLEQNPLFIQRIPLGYIASFLGISQETLSRIRSKKL